ncbi:MAG: N-acetylmuramoyl-L-alanine amidase [Alistipes sp.]|nr:N-acetylmuramoyl-L-alanine amidase [Alistipes sp.]
MINVLLVALLALVSLNSVEAQNRNTKVPKYLPDSVAAAITRITSREVAGSYVKIESIRIVGEEQTTERDSTASNEERKPPVMEIRASEHLGFYPMRENSVERLYDAVRGELPEKYKDYELKLYANGTLIEKLIPQYYRTENDDPTFVNSMSEPLITRKSSLSQPQRGLRNRHIALWQSHGRYFNNGSGEWSWQRARLWETVEDLYTQSYVVPYLVPMLERAGANVLLPRERSMRHYELIIDNDKGLASDGYKESGEWSNAGAGFAHLHESYPSGHNPFSDGSARMITSTTKKEKLGKATWSGSVPESGLYTLYVSYRTHKKSVADAHYTIHASGGDREFLVNQKMGGGMWVCLGEFYFEAGDSRVLVTLDNYSASSGVITADAVKIGGGMGNIRREVHSSLRSSGREYQSEVSGYPRFTEGARYWLQWSGFSTDVYAPKGGVDDYKDDYMSRPRWVNALMGGSQHYSSGKGKNIPLDLALAFHSDAGVRKSDKVIGTLGIYCTKDNNAKFEDSESRLRSRDLTDIVMTQIVDDLRAKYDKNWVRRGMWDKSYYEARIPWCPTMLLELLSHQNFADMRYGLDPNFRFDVSRAIYKGVLRYLSSQYGVEYVVQPLPIHSFAVALDGNNATLSWKPTEDVLEPTAMPDYYILYTRVDDSGFDTGRRVDSTTITLEQEAGKIYSYKVTAVNDGGESFDSEVLAAAVGKSKKKVLVVNGFDRVSAPMSRRSDAEAGFYNQFDSGVSYIEDIAFIGEQTNFDRALYQSQDDNNALGQSYNDFETEVIAGNTFDFVALHGRSILAAGYSFASASHAAVSDGSMDLSGYAVVDLILGKQRATAVGSSKEYRYEAMSSELQKILKMYTKNGGSLLVTGSYLLTDMWTSPVATDADRKFATDVLHASFGGAMATRRGDVKGVSQALFNSGFGVKFNTELNDKIYCVESPEVVRAAGKNAYTAMRYRASNQPAAIIYSGKYRTFVAGFPFETIMSSEERDALMKGVLGYLIK